MIEENKGTGLFRVFSEQTISLFVTIRCFVHSSFRFMDIPHLHKAYAVIINCLRRLHFIHEYPVDGKRLAVVLRSFGVLFP